MRCLCTYEDIFDAMSHFDGEGNCKGDKFYEHLQREYSNISCDVVQLFCITCPCCIENIKKSKPIAGHQPILIHGWAARGQVDLVDFQTMLYWNFKFLCNYIDFGCKFGASVPIVAKRESTVGLFLFDLFTVTCPSAILQSNNGREFTGHATSGKHIVLGDAVSDEDL